MVARFRSRRKNARKLLAVIGIIAVLVVVIALIFVEARVYGTGFAGKTLWDWLQLLIIPLVLAVAALLFNLATTRSEQKIATQRYEQDQNLALDKQREDLLQIYLDRMSELLLKEKLRSSAVNAEVRNVARVRTITILFQLDARRIGYVFAFLRESGLMSSESNDSIVSLDRANLRKINFSQVVLPEADLRRAILSNANFFEAFLARTNLGNANLNQANLNCANLIEANLSGAVLIRANLKDAKVTDEQLKQAKSFAGATMPDGSIHP